MMKFIDEIKSIDDSILKVMKKGFRISFIICIIATYILLSYIINPTSHVVFDAGYLLIKGGLMFFTSFFVGAMATNKIKKELF